MKHCGFGREGKYYYCWYSVKGVKGNIRRSLHGEKLYAEEQCHELLNALSYQIQKGTFDPASWGKRTNLTIDKAWDTYQTLKPAGKARTANRGRLFEIHIEPWFHKRSIADIKDMDVLEWYADLKKKGLKPSSLKTIVVTFKAFFRTMHRSIPVMPDFPAVSIPKAKIEYLTPEQQDQVHEFIPPWHLPIFRFWRVYGCRASEAGGLKKADIDKEKKQFTFRNTKQRADNPLPIVPEVEESLVGAVETELHRIGEQVGRTILQPKAKKRPPTNLFYVFATPRGLPYTRQRLYDIWQRANQKAHEKYRTPIINPENGNRHSLAMRLWDTVEHGKISRILGHGDRKTTEQYYGKYSPESLEGVLGK
jgi:integrase